MLTHTQTQIHLLVEILDRYFGNVCELDIIFNFHRAYAILYEVFVGGYVCETSKNEAIKRIGEMDRLVEEATQVRNLECHLSLGTFTYAVVLFNNALNKYILLASLVAENEGFFERGEWIVLHDADAIGEAPHN